MFGLFRNFRRRELRTRAWPEEWRKIAEKLPLYRRVPAQDIEELHANAHVLLHEKRFEGCGGMGITDEVRVTIATQAAALLLHRETDYFPTVASILVYPHPYWATHREMGKDGVVTEYDAVLAGEAWNRDVLVMAWDQVLGTSTDSHASHSIVLHEFAHALDFEDGASNGTPLMCDAELAERWAPVMEEAYEQLKKDADEGQQTVLNVYGAEKPAEFFAIAAEAFFLSPVALQTARPELYDLLKSYFRQDPAAEYAPAGQ